MDTMDVKHINCFGPQAIKEWNLQSYAKELLPRWNEVNLYTITRGINRFKGLEVLLTEVNEKYVKIEGLTAYVKWVNETSELSNGALKKAIEIESDNVCMQKALNWSTAVNQLIENLPDEVKKPFPLVQNAIYLAKQYANVAIVSSANIEAVLDEWRKHNLLDGVDVVLSQNVGSKAYCIGELLKKGYDAKNVVMCGDALGDMQSAEKNGVNYFPILVKREKESWAEFINVGLNKLLNGEFEGEYQLKLKQEFLKNLGAK
jgi:hypothetical protein